MLRLPALALAPKPEPVSNEGGRKNEERRSQESCVVRGKNEYSRENKGSRKKEGSRKDVL